MIDEEREVVNAKIEDARISTERCLTVWYTLDYDGACKQGAGGYALDSYSKEMDKRIPTHLLGWWY